MNKLVLFVLFLCVLFLSILNKQDRKPTKQELINQWKPRDFYLVYQYYFDDDLIKLRQEIKEFP
jgi:hypothetical protein